MEINRVFLNTILPVLAELGKKINCDFVVFGSAPLYLFKVLDFKDGEKINDLDLVVGDDFMPNKYDFEIVFFHDNPEQKFYKINIQGINIDIGSAWSGRERIYGKIFQSPFEFSGFKFANLSVIREWKELMVREYGREKDKRYLEMIQEYVRKNIEISDMASEEVDTVLTIKNQVWLDTYVSEQYGITEADLKSRKALNSERLERMRNIVSGSIINEHVWTAKCGGEIIGMCSAERGGDKNKLGSLYVLSQYQGLGIGTRLFEKALDWLGCDKPIEFGVAEYNWGSIESYKKFGFKVDGRMEDFVLPNKKHIPLVRMVKFF